VGFGIGFEVRPSLFFGIRVRVGVEFGIGLEMRRSALLGFG